MVDVAPGKLLVYAAPSTDGVPGLSLGSDEATLPVTGLRRKFCPALLTTRILSTVGLKSNPNVVPESAGVNAPVPTAIATPLAILIV